MVNGVPTNEGASLTIRNHSDTSATLPTEPVSPNRLPPFKSRLRTRASTVPLMS